MRAGWIALGLGLGLGLVAGCADEGSCPLPGCGDVATMVVFTASDSSQLAGGTVTFCVAGPCSTGALPLAPPTEPGVGVGRTVRGEPMGEIVERLVDGGIEVSVTIRPSHSLVPHDGDLYTATLVDHFGVTLAERSWTATYSTLDLTGDDPDGCGPVCTFAELAPGD